MVDGHHARQTKIVFDIVDVAFKVYEPGAQCVKVFYTDIFDFNAAVILQRSHSRD